MRKISTEKLDEMLEDSFGEDYAQELGLEESEKQSDKTESPAEKKEISTQEEKSTFLSDEEWKNGDFPLPTF